MNKYFCFIFIIVTVLMLVSCQELINLAEQTLAESEPNDGFYEYDQLMGDGKYLYGSIDSSTDEDYYRVAIKRSGSHNIKIKWISGNALDLAAEYYKSSEMPPSYGYTKDENSLKEDEEFTASFYEDEFNYIKVYNNNIGTGKYKISVLKL